jgi:hypothetical protein
MDISAPTRSGGRAAGFFESGTSGSANATPSAAIGTLIRNTDPHQNLASSKPPTIGPSAMPSPDRRSGQARRDPPGHLHAVPGQAERGDSA